MIIYSPGLGLLRRQLLVQLLSFTLPSSCKVPGLCHQPHRYKSSLQAAGDSVTGLQRLLLHCWLSQHLLPQCSASAPARNRARSLLAYRKTSTQTSRLLLTGSEIDSPASFTLLYDSCVPRPNDYLRNSTIYRLGRKKAEANRKKTFSLLFPEEFTDKDTHLGSCCAWFDSETFTS